MDRNSQFFTGYRLFGSLASMDSDNQIPGIFVKIPAPLVRRKVMNMASHPRSRTIFRYITLSPETEAVEWISFSLPRRRR